MQLGMLHLLNRTVSVYALFTAMNRIIHHIYLITEVIFLNITNKSQDFLLPLQADHVKKGTAELRSKNLEWIIFHTLATQEERLWF